MITDGRRRDAICELTAGPTEGAPRIGLLYPAADATAMSTWSGTPRGLREGLSALGMDVVPLCYAPAALPRYLVGALARCQGRRGYLKHVSPMHARLRTSCLRNSLAAAGPLTGIIAMGSDRYDLAEVVRGRAPVVTYDDGTLAQFQRHPDSDLRRMAYPDHEVRRWLALQAAACAAAAASCVSTRWAASSVVEDYGIPRARVHVVGMGHHPVPPGGRGARDWSDPAFLFVGADWERKNGDAVLAAFSRLRQALPGATLDVVGDHPRVDVAGVTGHGLLSRERPEDQARLHHLFNASTVFVLPSRFEPAGIAYLEAASAGLAVIATTEGGAREMLGDAAVVVHPADRDGLLAAMTRLSAPGEGRARGEAGRRRAATSDWKAVSRRILAILDGSSTAPCGALADLARNA